MDLTRSNHLLIQQTRNRGRKQIRKGHIENTNVLCGTPKLAEEKFNRQPMTHLIAHYHLQIAPLAFLVKRMCASSEQALNLRMNIRTVCIVFLCPKWPSKSIVILCGCAYVAYLLPTTMIYSLLKEEPLRNRHDWQISHPFDTTFKHACS